MVTKTPTHVSHPSWPDAAMPETTKVVEGGAGEAAASEAVGLESEGWVCCLTKSLFELVAAALAACQSADDAADAAELEATSGAATRRLTKPTERRRRRRRQMMMMTRTMVKGRRP